MVLFEEWKWSRNVLIEKEIFLTMERNETCAHAGNILCVFNERNSTCERFLFSSRFFVLHVLHKLTTSHIHAQNTEQHITSKASLWTTTENDQTKTNAVTQRQKVACKTNGKDNDLKNLRTKIERSRMAETNQPAAGAKIRVCLLI